MSSASFVDKYSWKCLLGPMSRLVEENDSYACWMVGKTKHVVLFKELGNVELIEKHVPFNYHYFSESDLSLIANKYKVEKNKCVSISIGLDNMALEGNKYKSLRRKLKQAEAYGIDIVDELKDYGDIAPMIEKWSNTCGMKYYRDYSGKNKFFYGKEFHIGCINSFCYKGNDLVAYGTLSPPNFQGNCTYIIGKALCYQYPGLSELLDFSLYKKAIGLNAKMVNLGGSFTKGVLAYKAKFPGASQFIEYEGKVKNVR